MYSNEYIQRGILYFDWDTKDFQKALPALISFPINGNSFPSFFIMLFIHPISSQSHLSNALLSIYQVSLN